MADLEVESHGGSCYYSVLGIRKQASAAEICGAYRRLALHPDRWMKGPKVAGEAKKWFQQIQEAYSVLSDEGKRLMYDAGLLNFLENDDDEEGNSLEELRGLLWSMMEVDESIKFWFDLDTTHQGAGKMSRVAHV